MEYSFWGGLMLMVLMADPLGNIPITISCMKNVPNKRRTFVLFRECMIAMGMLLLAMFFGRPFLAAIGLSDAALSIGGSVIVMLFEWGAVVVITCVVSFFVLASADWLERHMGEKLTLAFERLTGLLLAMMATQMFLGGVEAFLAKLPH